MDMREPELSRLVVVERIPASGQTLKIAATPEERAALAKRLDLKAIDRLDGDVRLKRASGGEVRVAGSFSADVVQSCVVTLEPVAQSVEGEFAERFSPDAPPEDAEIEAALEGEDAPFPIHGGAIDVGEVVAQHLSLSLDPYPRAPGVAFDVYEAGAEAPDEKPESPFAKLASLKRGD